MKQLITSHPGFSFASIINKQAKITTAYLSVDLHGEKTASKRATELVYAEALLAGAGKYDRSQFLSALSTLGATVSVSISDGILTVHIRATSAVFPKVLSIVETMLIAPRFETSELKRIKLTLTNLLKERQEESKIIAHELLRNELYGQSDRRYSFAEQALISLFPKINKKELDALHKRTSSLHWTASIAGNEADVKRFEASVKRCKPKTTVTTDDRIHQQKTPQPGLILRDIPSRQNIDFSIGAPLPISIHHPDYLPLAFGITVLGKWGGFAGRLMSTVRELEGLTYGIYAKTETFFNDEQGYWRVSTFFSPKQALQGITSTMREVTKLFEEGITPQEFDRFKAIIHTGDVLKNDSTASLLGELHSYHLQGFTLKEIESYKKRLDSITIKEVNAAVTQYLNPKWLTISGAGPIKDAHKSLQDFVKTMS